MEEAKVKRESDRNQGKTRRNWNLPFGTWDGSKPTKSVGNKTPAYLSIQPGVFFSKRWEQGFYGKLGFLKLFFVFYSSPAASGSHVANTNSTITTGKKQVGEVKKYSFSASSKCFEQSKHNNENEIILLSWWVDIEGKQRINAMIDVEREQVEKYRFKNERASARLFLNVKRDKHDECKWRDLSKMIKQRDISVSSDWIRVYRVWSEHPFRVDVTVFTWRGTLNRKMTTIIITILLLLLTFTQPHCFWKQYGSKVWDHQSKYFFFFIFLYKW